MDFVILNILFFIIYALLFVICMAVIHFIFTITRVEVPEFGLFIGILAGMCSSLIMIFIIHNMPI